MVKWILLLSSFITSCAFAVDQPKVTMFTLRGSAKGKELAWVTSTKWAFTTNSEGARVLKAAVFVRVPDGFASQGQLVADSDSLEISNKGADYLLKVGALKSRLIYRTKGGTETPMEVDMVPQANIFGDKCRDANVEFRVDGSKPPFSIGAACTMDGTKVRFHLTFPEEAQTGESTLFESKGKGESWRIYDLGDINAATTDIGKIQLLYDGKTYNFTLASLRTKNSDKIKQDDAKKFFSASLGYTNLSLSGTGTGSGGGVFFSGSAKPDPLLIDRIGVGGDVNVANPLSAGAGFSYLLIAPYAYARVLKGPAFQWDLRGYLTFISLSQSTTGVGVQSTQPALGTTFAFNTARMSYQLGYMSLSLVAKQTIDASQQISLRVMRKGAGRLDYGGGVLQESLTATSLSGYTYNYSLVGAFLTVGF